MAFRTKMDIAQRAKQFAPFSALKGFEEALRAKEKIIVPKIELTEESMEELNRKLLCIEKKDMNYHSPAEEKENPLINNVNQTPVPVIATFSKDGKILPLYFSIEGIRLRIDHIKWQSDKALWGNQYRCEVTLGDRVEEVDLYYYKTNSIWTMRKKDR